MKTPLGNVIAVAMWNTDVTQSKHVIFMEVFFFIPSINHII